MSSKTFAAAIAFFTALGMTLEGEMPVEGPWVDRVNGLEGVQVDIVMLRTPDGHGRLEPTKFRNPKLVENWSRSNRRSHRRTPWASAASCLQSKASTTLSLACAPTAPNSSARAQYEDKYRLCYMRGSAGIIVALAEELF